MITDLQKIWTIFTPSERRKSVWMLVLVILMAMADTLGVLSIMPFLSVLGRPEVIQTNHFLNAAYEQFGFHTPRSFIFALGMASITLVVLSSAFKTVTLHTLNRFVHFQRHSISSRLLSRYLHQPYEFFLGTNPSMLARNVLSARRERRRRAADCTTPTTCSTWVNIRFQRSDIAQKIITWKAETKRRLVLVHKGHLS